jgi:hypothetical protein
MLTHVGVQVPAAQDGEDDSAGKRERDSDGKPGYRVKIAESHDGEAHEARPGQRTEPVECVPRTSRRQPTGDAGDGKHEEPD